MVGQKSEGRCASSLREDRATDAPHGAPSGLRPDGSVSTSAGHTPGPWQVSGTRHSGDLRIGRDTRLHAVGPDEDAVAMVFYDMKTGRGLKDARLIAAAPDMLNAIRAVTYQLCSIEGRTKGDKLRICDQIAVLNAAIAKATGAA